MTDPTRPDPAPPGNATGRRRLPAWLTRVLRLGGSAPDAENDLALRPISRPMLFFTVTVFFLSGVAITSFVLIDPFDLGPAGEPAGGDRPVAASPANGAPRQLYQCPMHAEVIESEPGNCPICKMALTPIRSTTPGGAATESREILYWYAPMDPTYTRDSPGKSPMGMDLVPKYADSGGSADGVVRIDPVQVQNIGVVSRRARSGEISRTIRTVGFLDYNADDVTWVNPKFSGWIERVHVSYVGQHVKKGQPLFDIYSPELVTTQEEYLRALEYKASLETSDRLEARRQAESLLRSTRDRLSYWDISDGQIAALEERGTTQRRLTVFSPADGVVTEIMEQALEGMSVQAGMNLYKIAEMSTVWVHADVYETDLPWVREGLPAEVSFRHDPDRIYRGQVLFLYPEVSSDTRTLKICVEVPNRDRRLRAGMYADVVVHGPTTGNAVLAPKSAVLRSGERNLVFVDLGEGHFEPREVTLGIEAGSNEVQIVSGLAAGESVVTQAQFMLDSESRVQEAIAKFMTRRTEPSSYPASSSGATGESEQDTP